MTWLEWTFKHTRLSTLRTVTGIPLRHLQLYKRGIRAPTPLRRTKLRSAYVTRQYRRIRRLGGNIFTARKYRTKSPDVIDSMLSKHRQIADVLAKSLDLRTTDILRGFRLSEMDLDDIYEKYKAYFGLP